MSSGMAQVEQARHAIQRGGILSCLHGDYASRMTSVRALQSAMDMLGEPMSFSSLAFHLHYLSDSGYLRLWTAADMPGFRADRSGDGDPHAVKFAKLLPKGIQLLDGAIEADPLVRFA